MFNHNDIVGRNPILEGVPKALSNELSAMLLEGSRNTWSARPRNAKSEQKRYRPSTERTNNR